MSVFNLFGKLKKRPSAESSCSFCGKTLKERINGMNALDLIKNTGYRCDNCDQVTCGQCGAETAAKSGAQTYLCPACKNPLPLIV